MENNAPCKITDLDCCKAVSLPLFSLTFLGFVPALGTQKRTEISVLFCVPIVSDSLGRGLPKPLPSAKGRILGDS